MRSILFTEELMGVALNFSKKSSSPLGRLWVSWEPVHNSTTPVNDSSPSKPIPSRCSSLSSSSLFHRRIQTGISLCFVTLLFTALAFFLVCTLDSSFAKNFPSPSQSFSSSSSSSSSFFSSFQSGSMGTVFQRGTRSMTEIVIAHIGEDVSSQELSLFLRVLQRSGLLSRADLVLLFPGDPQAPRYSTVVSQEIERFNRLLLHSGCSSSPIKNVSLPDRGSIGPSCRGGEVTLLSNSTFSRLNLEAFIKAEEDGRARAESALTRLLRNTTTLTGLTGQDLEDWLDRRAGNWIPPRGSITGFDVAELDPLDTLSGFIDEPGIQLRRWLCYGMLLGTTREHQRYRQVVIAQVRGVFLLGDGLLAMARRGKDSRALVLVTENRTWLEESSRGVSSGPSSSSRVTVASDDEDNGSKLDSLSGLEQQGVDWSGEREQHQQQHKRKRSYGQRQRRRRRRQGLIEEVYGRQVWGSIEAADKAEWEVVSGAVVAGGARAIRALADAVATEVARAAMMRRNRHAFGDQAALNYVVRRNVNVLGRKVVEQVAFVSGGAGDGAGGVRLVTRGTVSEIGGATRYDAVVAGSGDFEALSSRVAEDLCSSPRESVVYSDCHRDQ